MNTRLKICSLAALMTVALFNACDEDTSGPNDVTAPRRVTNLTIALAGEDSLRLQWTAPGDDGGSGTAASYQIRRSSAVINEGNFGAATAIANPPAPAAGGTLQELIVAGIDTTLVTHFALRASDEAGNVSPVSNDAAWTPLNAPLHLVKDIPPYKDNTMYEESDSSNGAGDHIFAGTAALGNPYARRGLIAFAIADSLPANAVIDSVELTLRLSRVAPGSTTKTVDLHRATADWGEGLSDASGEEGIGATPQANDATWTYRFYDTSIWTTLGGDFSASSSGQLLLGALGFYTWKTATMTSDVQGWLDAPVNNFGWVLVGDESTTSTARRFDSRENPNAANRPRLRVYYTVTP